MNEWDNIEWMNEIILNEWDNIDNIEWDNIDNIEWMNEIMLNE